MATKKAHFILYVRDQAHSTAYYGAVLGLDPVLSVPGMTEFQLRDGTVLGLMPRESAVKLLGTHAFRSSDETIEPRAELYLLVDDPGAYHQRALNHGGRELSPMRERDWGHRAAYSMDGDGHVLAFAEVMRASSLRA